jgi:uncharacterized protein
LPICGGGCANKRLRRKQFGEADVEFCSPYKDNLISYLEGYIDNFLSREICAALLDPASQKTDSKGYRVVSPAKNKAGEVLNQAADLS